MSFCFSVTRHETEKKGLHMSCLRAKYYYRIKCILMMPYYMTDQLNQTDRYIK